MTANNDETRYTADQQSSAPEASERELFEKAMNDKRFFPRELNFTRTKSPSGRDEYANGHLQSAWDGWQASRQARPHVPGWMLMELRGQIHDMQEAAYTYGDHNKEAVSIALDGVIDAIDEMIAAAPSVQSNTAAPEKE